MVTDDIALLAQRVVNALIAHKHSITTAESCTGGLLAAAITDISGSSAVFERGIISYGNNVKRDLLGVTEESLENEGAVSKVTAREMAVGARLRAKSHLAISITGIAGPTGGTVIKPVGLVFIGVSTASSTDVERHQFNGNRKEIREQAVQAALLLALNSLRRSGNTPI